MSSNLALFKAEVETTFFAEGASEKVWKMKVYLFECL